MYQYIYNITSHPQFHIPNHLITLITLTIPISKPHSKKSKFNLKISLLVRLNSTQLDIRPKEKEENKYFDFPIARNFKIPSLPPLLALYQTYLPTYLFIS